MKNNKFLTGFISLIITIALCCLQALSADILPLALVIAIVAFSAVACSNTHIVSLCFCALSFIGAALFSYYYKQPVSTQEIIFQNILFSMFYVFPGYACGTMLKKNFTFLNIVVVMSGLLLLPVLFMLFYWKLHANICIADVVFSTMANNVARAVQTLSASGADMQSIISVEQLSAVINAFTVLIPAFIIIMALFTALISFIFARKLIRILLRYESETSTFSNITLPRNIRLIALLSMFICLLSKNMISIVFSNFILIVFALFFFQGLCVIDYKFKPTVSNFVLRLLVYGFGFILLSLLSGVILLANPILLLALLGFIDSGIDLRHIRNRKDVNRL